MFHARDRWIFRLGVLLGCASLSIAINSGCSKPEAAKPMELAELSKKQPLSQQADESVRRALRGLEQRQARALWEFLPASYRRDVQRFARDFAGRLDEKSWEALVATWQKARRVLPPKLESLVASQSRAPGDSHGTSLPFDPKTLRQFLDTIGDSELSDLRRFRTVELDRFLDETGNKLLTILGRWDVGHNHALADDPFSQFAKVQVELTSSMSETATVTIRWPGQEPTPHKFVRVEDQWIPQSLAEAWPVQFAEVRERTLVWADRTREHSAESQMRLREINDWLDELVTTKSDEDLRQVWHSGVTRLAVAWFGTVLPNEAPRAESDQLSKPVRVKRPETEVLLPDEPTN